MQPENSIKESIDNLRNDLKGFIGTRFEILRAELTGGLKKVQSAAILFAVAALFALMGFVLLCICTSLAVALAFGAFANQTGLIWGFLITGLGTLTIAAILGMMGKSRVSASNLIPQRTLRVLKRDQQALQQQRGGQYVESERTIEAEPERRRA